ncbi:winged helix-turn-helix transcriptional regulator [Luteimonas saliphila]|uniref:winged helix-turn-helix transcriptional regulator n=1 Tax=Luteimonas saliphila TaxID=2804919 RepID=UPI00192DAE2E|nr:helix-turn-helix domain-containing protein [Luteimonas saliphila]
MAATHTHVRPLDPPADEIRAALDLLARVGDRWTVFVIRALWPGPLRYNALHRTVAGISQRMLTLTLKAMERDGLVGRTVLPTTPPQVEYALTDLGRSLVVPLHGLYAWTLRHLADIEAARGRFAASGHAPVP